MPLNGEAWRKIKWLPPVRVLASRSVSRSSLEYHAFNSLPGSVAPRVPLFPGTKDLTHAWQGYFQGRTP